VRSQEEITPMLGPLANLQQRPYPKVFFFFWVIWGAGIYLPQQLLLMTSILHFDRFWRQRPGFWMGGVCDWVSELTSPAAAALLSSTRSEEESITSAWNVPVLLVKVWRMSNGVRLTLSFPLHTPPPPP
jgi:hypothetical protein